MAEAKRRGPRLDATVEPRVIEAVLDELATVGRDHLSMDGIANRAGVSKATVYTRWRSKEELLLAAYQHLSRPFPELDAGSLSADLDALCDIVLAGAADPRYTAVLTEFVAAAATNPSLQPHLHASPARGRTESRECCGLRTSGASSATTPPSRCWPRCSPLSPWRA